MTEPVRLTYVFICGKDTHHDLRSKDRAAYFTKEQLAKDPAALLKEDEGVGKLFPEWNFDGSSTGQAMGLDTEILIRPVAAWPSPFKVEVPQIIVLCECFTPNGQPTPDNTRFIARHVFDQQLGLKPWFGLEQEFVLMQNGRPYGWPMDGFPAPQGPYYCSTGRYAYGRHITDRLMECLLRMRVKCSGTNAEVLPGQWEFQIGPCEGIELGDHLVIARWVLLRICEEYSDIAKNEVLDVSYAAKPIEGDWNGSGLHSNFSTTETRNPETGREAIKRYLRNLEKTLKKDLTCYGSENAKRLTGKHETSSFAKFTFGVGTRTTSVRIPNAVEQQGFGYFEDRRPAGDCDPYLVTSRLFASACSIESTHLDTKGESLRLPWMVF